MKTKSKLMLKHTRLGCELLEPRLVLSTLPLADVEFRTIDGTGNNLINDSWGAADTQMIRFGYGARFLNPEGDVIINENTDPSRANPRTISNELMAQDGSIPSARLLTDWSFQWGQWLTHDLDLTPNGAQFNVLSDGTVGNFNIPILDPNDPFGIGFIPFNRSEFVEGTGVDGQRREVINVVTSYIDASNVYGSDDLRAAELRTFEGGKLKTSADGLLLPYNVNAFPNADQFGAGSALFLAGDVRANEQVGLTAVHTLFVREHNRLADVIIDIYPHLNDEEIYQVARRIVGAQQQVITYREYLPAILGYDFAPDPYQANYDPNVNASITNAFAHALFRFGHSEINETILLVNNANQTVGEVTIRDAFFNPNILTNDPSKVDLLMKGLASQVGQEVDLYLVDAVRNNLFGPPGSGGLDLGALDIQRGRDHGLPDYNNLRGNYGLTPVTSFAEITSDPVIQAKLEALYGNVNNIDAFVGALAEDKLPGTSVGPLLHGIIANQFLRLRDGDRFFYTNDPFLQSAEVKAIIDINNVRLSDIIKWNTGITNIQENVFFDRSVLFFEAPQSGSNISVVAALGVITIIDNTNLNVLAVRSLASVSQVVLVGSSTNADVFNLFIAGANGGIENGVFAYGRSSAGDRLNVFGRPLLNDTFNVSGQTVSANTTTTQDSEVVLERSVDQVFIAVNNNQIASSGFETTRLVTLGGGDVINDPTLLAIVVALWNPLSSN